MLTIMFRPLVPRGWVTLVDVDYHVRPLVPRGWVTLVDVDYHV
jgi:hypothetical protein